MKFLFTKAAQFVITLFFYITAFSQANTSLSNLTSTAVNRDLNPALNNSIYLGSLIKNWRYIYIGEAYYLKNYRIISMPDTSSFFAGPNAGAMGIYNIGLGHRTLAVNTTGRYNTALGFEALRRNTTGVMNTASGFQSLVSNTTGSSNTANGFGTLMLNTTGGNNTASGYGALSGNTTASNNSAYGYRALSSNTLGWGNTATGSNSLASNTSGVGNTANGYNCLESNGSGSFNTATGYHALEDNTTGAANTAIGYKALYSNTTGTYNSALGFGAGSSSTIFTNTTAIGALAMPTASNQVMLGSSSVTSVRAAGSFIIYSDGRFKKNVSNNVPGLEFIKLLHPVTYHYDIRGLDQKTGAAKAREKIREMQKGNNIADVQFENAAIDTKEKKLYTGFVAQDVEAAAKKLNYDFSGVYIPQNENDVYGLSYSDFVAPMVKAIQELSDSKDSLQQLVLTLEERLAKMETILKINTSSTLKLSDATIAQNTPNPFRSNTLINYNLPQEGLSNARVMVYDATGKRLRLFNLSGHGRGTINLDASLLPAGTYQYSLIINGNIVDTKKMLLLK